jgi:Derlin-2/3
MNSNILASQLVSTPPITRFISLSIIVIMVLVYINAVQSYALLYSPLFLRYMEIWRVFTCFLYFGKPSLDVLIHITFLYRYSKMLEEGFIYTSDYFYLIFVVWGLLFIIANIFSISMLASAFSSTITYIWTRKNPQAVVQIFGFISFPAFYLPFIVPLFMLVTEKRILVEDLLGIIVGHFYFFFKDVYPKWGRDVLKTPCFIKKMFREHTNDCCQKRKVGRVLNIGYKVQKNTSNIANDTSNIANDTSNIANDTLDTSVLNSFVSDKTADITNQSVNLTTKTQDESIRKEEPSVTEPDKPFNIDEEISLKNESKGFIDNGTCKIGEKSINEYLISKVKEDDEEEIGWSSQSLTDTESD